jgi:putative glutathione S-transferase
MRDLYFKVDPEYTGRYTVPVLWDKVSETIVNNESSEIIRMLYTEFDSVLPEEYRSIDLYPEFLRSSIDDANEWMYSHINNGV